jgi:hypothetical protein
MAAALSTATWFLAVRTAGRAPRFLHLLPALLVGVCAVRYVYCLDWLLAAVVAVAAACAYAALPADRRWLRFACFLPLAAATWYVAGGAVLLLGAACALHELVGRRAWASALGCAAVAALLPFVAGSWLLPMQMADAYLRATPVYDLAHFRLPSGFEAERPWACAAALLLWLPMLLPLLARPTRADRPAAEGSRRTLLARLVRGDTPWAVDAILATLAFAAVLGGGLDVNMRSRLRVEKYARTGDWRRVLAAAAALPRQEYGFVVNWDANRALYHLGELPDRMFELPQHPLGLFPSARYVPGMHLPYSCWMKLGDVMMDLGRVNEAEHMTYESMEFLGDQPCMLRRLVMIYAAKSRPETARIVLGALSRDLISGRWARGFLGRLRGDPSFAWHEPTQRLRGLMAQEDQVGWSEPVDLLRDLLTRNPDNRMAFEYLMAEYLLRRDLQAFVLDLGRLREFGFTRLPRCYQEAVVLREGTTGRAVDTAGWAVSDATWADYREFCRVVAMYPGNRDAARAAAAPRFGRTYFYYYTFGRSGDTQ